MPLIKSKSPKAFSKNVKAEVNAGKPVKQAVAIAYSAKRKASDDFAKGAQADEGAAQRGFDKRLGITKNDAPSIRGKGSLAQALAGK